MTAADAVRPRRALVVLAVAVVVVAAVALGRSLSTGSSKPRDPLLNRPAPQLSGTTLTGKTFRHASWRDHVTIVNIWASWCGPCRDELPAIAAFVDRAGPHVDVVTINTRDGPVAARSLLEEVHATGLVAVEDPHGRMAVRWGATGVPETFVVDSDGVIRARARGGVTTSWLERQVDRWRGA